MAIIFLFKPITKDASMSADFVYLHVHTQYSLLDGAIRFQDLFAKCKEFGMEAVAISGSRVHARSLKIYLAAQKSMIKPIIGSEFYLAPGGHQLNNANGITSALGVNRNLLE